MERRLKILHLEDSPHDAELVERQLRKANLSFDTLVVSGKQEFQNALSHHHPDIILCDHSLPDIDSHQALRLSRQQPVPVPLILVTATVSEEYAVEIMKEGAYDYILKDRLQRLPKAIENAIEKWIMEKERQEYMEKTIASENRYRQIVETAQEGIWLINSEGRTTFVNQKLCEMLEYAADEIVDRKASDFMDEKSKALAEKLWRKDEVQHGEKTELTLIDKHGKTILACFSTSAVLDRHGKFTGVLAMVTDITNKRIAEEKLQRERSLLRTLIDNIPDYIFVKDTNGRHLVNNTANVRLLGFQTEEETLGKSLVDLIPDGDYEGFVEEDRQVLQSGKPLINKEECITTSSGDRRWFLTTKIPLKDERGLPIGLIGISRDITTRKAIEKKLRQFNERYEFLSKATNDAIWDWDIKRNVITWNHGLHSIFGYTENATEYSFDWLVDKIHPEDRTNAERSIHDAFAGKQNTWSFTYRFATADGMYKFVHDRAYVIYDENYKPVRMIGAMQDISARMEAIEEIEKLSFVASKISNAVVITDAAQNIEWVNDSFSRMTGYSSEEVRGRKSDFLWGPETDGSVVNRMNAMARRQEPFSGELINYSKTGRKYWTKVNITPVFNDVGELKNFIAIQTDITEQKEFENKITTIAREISSLIENANVPIFGIDRNGYINEWNKVSQKLSGISKSELVGKKWLEELVGPENREAAGQMIAGVLQGNSVSNFELPVVTKTRKRLILLLSASPRRDTEKGIHGAIMVAQDVTELIEYRRNLEKMVQDRTRELNEALQKEKELVNMKSKFVSIASHEFRTPLSTITLATGFLKKFTPRLKPEDIQEKLVGIEKQVHHMTHLLDDVLMIGKIEGGKIPVRLTPVNTLDFFEKLIGEVEQSTARTHEIRLINNLQVPTIISDEKLLRNIVINTLTNAIKFSPGAKHVDLTLRSDFDKFSFAVRDYGIGIPQGDMKQLFEPFHRGSNVNAIQGTGLGLSIIKKAVDLLHGFIDVKSEVGKGTELNIILPVMHE
jgi:PAS domain S-box-containing protein